MRRLPDGNDVSASKRPAAAADTPAGEQLAIPTGRRSRVNTGMTEAALLAAVRQLAKYNNWMTYHTQWSRGSEPGFPDLLLVNARQQRIIFAELKSPTGKTTPAQDLWLAALTAAGAEVALWRPADLPDIAAVLRGRRLAEHEPPLT